MPNAVGTRSGRVLLVGLFGGLTLGVLARLWMRTISTDPEFSWGGTIGILIVFVVFGIAQASVHVLRKRVTGKQRTTTVRLIGGLFSLSIFVGAGGLMFPTVAMGSIALWRREFSNKTRIILVALSLIIPGTVAVGVIADFGWEVASVGKVFFMILIYGAVVIATQPTVSAYEDPNYIPEPMSKLRKVVIFIGIVFVCVFFFLLTAGIPGR